jgi:4-amino-4-deoxy-L-arabinose transferase-like glycosyltransferase
LTETKGTGVQPARASEPARIPVLLIVLLFASAVYFACIVSPPSLMDDVDAVQAQIARNMLTSGDWVTARLDGVPYLEKAPLIYWLIALAFRIFGPYDWAARIVIALSSVALCLITAAFGRWAFGRRGGLYAGLCMSTCVGLFLFTRILIPDVLLVAAIALGLWAFLRALDAEERHPAAWAALFAASMGVGLLLKSLIGVVFPLGAAVLYLFLTSQLFARRTWRRLHPVSGLLIILAIALPWHVIAMLRNPPWFDFTMHSVPGEYHGFFWFFFINEQLLRFLNLRYPRDYNTVPRTWFWLLHLVWLFPWSVYLPAVLGQSFRPVDRAGRTRLLAFCLTGFVLIFFTFSTTQEYYSMPVYPALALLIGSAMAAGGKWLDRGVRLVCVISGCAAVVVFALAFLVRNVATPGDISTALSSNPAAYTLSMGHIEDLTLKSFAYLRTPLLLAGLAFLVGFAGTIRATGQRAFLAIALMMVLFFQAARLALVVFDPYMGSRPIAEALLHDLPGELIVDHHYYTFSSVFFYTNRTALLLNGRFNNLVYGSYAPGAPDVFIDDPKFHDLWLGASRYYIVASDSALPRLTALVGKDALHLVLASGGKVLLTNQAIAAGAS